jgi:hypothetical protein
MVKIDGTNGIDVAQLRAPDGDPVAMTIDGAGAVAFPATPSAPDNGIGVGQTWQDLTASRAAATDYTNNTGKPIQVLITFGNGSTAGSADVIVGGVTIAQPNAVGNGPRQGCSFIVPDGVVYRANVTGGVTLQKWSELR